MHGRARVTLFQWRRREHIDSGLRIYRGKLATLARIVEETRQAKRSYPAHSTMREYPKSQERRATASPEGGT